jgi:hypothetical protein
VWTGYYTLYYPSPPPISLPYTVVMFFIGYIISSIVVKENVLIEKLIDHANKQEFLRSQIVFDSVLAWKSAHPHAILFVLLPPLLVDTFQHLSSHGSHCSSTMHSSSLWPLFLDGRTAVTTAISARDETLLRVLACCLRWTFSMMLQLLCTLDPIATNVRVWKWLDAGFASSYFKLGRMVYSWLFEMRVAGPPSHCDWQIVHVWP